MAALLSPGAGNACTRVRGARVGSAAIAARIGRSGIGPAPVAGAPLCGGSRQHLHPVQASRLLAHEPEAAERGAGLERAQHESVAAVGGKVGRDHGWVVAEHVRTRGRFQRRETARFELQDEGAGGIAAVLGQSRGEQEKSGSEAHRARLTRR